MFFVQSRAVVVVEEVLLCSCFPLCLFVLCFWLHIQVSLSKKKEDVAVYIYIFVFVFFSPWGHTFHATFWGVPLIGSKAEVTWRQQVGIYSLPCCYHTQVGGGDVEAPSSDRSRRGSCPSDHDFGPDRASISVHGMNRVRAQQTKSCTQQDHAHLILTLYSVTIRTSLQRCALSICASPLSLVFVIG